jgi:hypothetical protein
MLLLLLVGVPVAIGAQVLGLPVSGQTAATLGLFGVGIGFTALAVSLLYQAVFIYRHPKTAIEHDIQPPSKYDMSFDSRRGAKKTAFFGLLAGVFGLVLGGGALLAAGSMLLG